MTDMELNTRRARRLLSAIADLAREASLTGSLEGGVRTATRQYNRLLNYLWTTGVVPHELFPQLEEEQANFDELGVACALLSAFIEDEEAESQPATAQVIVAKGDSQELAELRELSHLIRERMPEVLRVQQSRQPDKS